MGDKPEPCNCYSPWEDHGVSISQCLEYGWRDGRCGAELSPYYKQDCPWPNGYPCQPATGEGVWKAPPLKGNGIAQLLRLDDEANPDIEVEDD